MGQRAVFRGVDPVQGASQDAQGAPPGLEGPEVGLPVYAPGEARDHPKPGLGQLPGEPPGKGQGPRGGPARAHEGHRLPFRGKLPLQVEVGGRLGKRPQPLGEALLPEAQEAHP